MIIGIDADGVLTDMSGFNYKYGEIFWKRKPVNPAGYTTAEIFRVSRSQEFLFGLKYFYEYCCKLRPRERAFEANQRLNSDGHTLYEITARKFSIMKNPLGWLSRHLFKRWLNKNNLHFEDVFFCSESNTPAEKLHFCKQFSVEIMIDDKPDVALFLAENGIAVLLFDAPYNKDVNHKNIIRVSDWNEIYRRISDTASLDSVKVKGILSINKEG